MRDRRGFTMVEMLIVLVLATLLIAKIVLLLQMQENGQSRTFSKIAVEDNARRVMDQIHYAIAGASSERLNPEAEAPFFSSELNFEVSLGVVDGEVVWGDPEWLGLTGAEGQLAWKERPDQPDERRVVWCNAVRSFLAGELMNGVDDNGNGLVDEKGLAISVKDSRVTVRLTLERKDTKGQPVASTLTQTVTCRN